jgi:hypothetical protein
MKKMKKLFMFLCIVVLFFGISGCPGDDAQFISSKPSVVKKISNDNPSGSGALTVGESTEGSPVPEPTTLALLGAGLIGLVGFGRKKFKK